MIEQVDVEIGGQLIDRHYADWFEIWAQLTVPAGHETGYRKMIGQRQISHDGVVGGLQVGAAVAEAVIGSAIRSINEDRKVYVPHQFWFCRNVGLALPLIALQYHEVKITVQFAQSTSLVIVGDATAGVPDSQVADYANGAAGLSPTGSLDAALWVDYIYLDTDERRRFAQVSHEYLIEQLQFTGDESYAGGSSINVPVTLNFNHPVKELVWVAKETTRTPNGQVTVGNPASIATDPVAGTSVNEHSNYTDISAMSYINMAAYGLGGDLVNNDAVTTGTLHKNPAASGVITARNPIVSAKLQLNGHDRFATRDGTYFNRVQTRCHTRIPQSPGINVYSFALKPEDHQPSGTCNFSRIDNARLQLTMRSNLTGGNVKVFATNYNVLRIMSGMGGLAYSN